MDMDRNRDTDRQGQGHKWTGAGTQRDRERGTNGHVQVYEHRLRQLEQTSYKKIRALKALSI
jgi:hypothetical protein